MATISACDVRERPRDRLPALGASVAGLGRTPTFGARLGQSGTSARNDGFGSNLLFRSERAKVWNRVRRETGKELMVRVHYDEGAAIHIGPESCAGGREAVREALTGECAGQPLSHEKDDIPGADAVRYAEGHTKGRAIASSPTTRRGRRPWHVQTLFVREPGGLVADQGGMPRLVRIGKARSRSR